MMEIIQTIWTALTTQNELLVKILYLPLGFIDAIVTMLLFTTLLDIKSTKKSKIIYVVSFSILGFLIRTFVLNPYSTFCNIFVMILSIKFILKASWPKTLFSEFIALIISSVLELFMLQLSSMAFHISYDFVMTIPIYRIIFTLSIYLCIFLLYLLVRSFKIHINLEIMDKKNKALFFLNALLGILAIGVQFYLIVFYSDKMPIGITIISIVSLIGFFFISIYNLLNTTKLATTSLSLAEAQLHNKTLIILHDNMRTFKHDFNNIVQGLGGYIETENLEGLKKYYSQLLKDCNRVNNLTALNPTLINNPAIYNILATKYHKADEIDVQITLEVLVDLNEFEKQVKIYEFTRILGILMDNAIEAASECDDKMIRVNFRNEQNRRRLVMVIENTYADKEVDVDRIFDKDFTTKSKKTNSGLGLWEVRQILKKNNNLNLFTTKNEEYFIQQLEIYY